LHYFDYLLPDRAIELETAIGLVNSWVENNPPGTQDAWDPFPISLRLVNWLKYFSTFQLPHSELEEVHQSTYQQALWLEKNLEYHLLANHLIKNAKALIFAGAFFKGVDADRWLRKGVGIYDEQLDEQILPDGGHFERSPMYHVMILEDCLDLLNISSSIDFPAFGSLRSKLQKVAEKMARFLIGMTHPDGQIALFNDAALDIVQPSERLAGYYKCVTGSDAALPNNKSWGFPDTGYFVMAPNEGELLLIDCGPIGPDYQPGHSHCDTLSFELSLKGRRVIVDSGCFQYGDGLIRQYNRSNVGHNTVTIDGENQSEVWAAHRCARRAYPLHAKLEEREDGSIVFEGAHDGYKRLKGQPIHHRTIRWENNLIEIEDRIEGSGQHDIESRLHIHPDLKVARTDAGVQFSREGNLLMTISSSGHNSIEIEDGFYCPEFGLKYNCPVLSLKSRDVSLSFNCVWKIKVQPASNNT
jgi:uncharacterized heparinase superfamily protein